MMYEGLHPGDCRGSKPVKKKLAHNFDCSGFIPLVREVYYMMEIKDRLPFCIFQHAMTEFLVAYQLYYAAFELKVPALRSLMNPLVAIKANYRNIPEPIYNYICRFGKTTAPTGDRVYWNLPDIAIPQGPIVDDQKCIRSGTFGPITAENHNVYECYISPYVTSEYIRQSANPLNIPSTEFYYWNPLPLEWIPKNSTVNENLLGYRPIEGLTESMKKKCSECDFVDEYSIQGLLCHSNMVMSETDAIMNNKKVSVVKANFRAMEDKAAFIFKEVIDKADVATILWDEPGKLKSPFSFSSSDANTADFFTFKRKRNNFAPGTCCLTNGEPPEGWLETINSNFTCSDPFDLQRGFHDRESLRDENHED